MTPGRVIHADFVRRVVCDQPRAPLPHPAPVRLDVDEAAADRSERMLGLILMVLSGIISVTLIATAARQLAGLLS